MPRLKGEGNARSWPPIHVETLEKLWSEGKTATQISKEIPYSRSAILGMAHRRNLEARPRVVKPPKPKPRVLPVRMRVETMIDLVSNHTPLREAAELAALPFTQARSYFNWMLNHYDMGEPPAMGDDVVRPVRR